MPCANEDANEEANEVDEVAALNDAVRGSSHFRDANAAALTA